MRTLDEKPGVLLLSGGVGGARLARGFSRLEEWDTTVVVNTGDDDWVYGVYVAPDLDTVVYTLAEAEGPQGWGLVNETWQVMESLSGFPIDTTFRLGDRDLATNLFRTMRIGEGKPLSLITEEIPQKVNADVAYQNAREHSDEQNARIEHDRALRAVMTAILSDDAQLFRLYSDNESFKRWLTDTIFDLTYRSLSVPEAE